MTAIVKLRDLGCAAALTSLGFEVREIEHGAGAQLYFLFTKTDELERSVSAYWANTLEVRARTYSESIKMLKSRIYSER
jgi:hypothetical protein